MSIGAFDSNALSAGGCTETSPDSGASIRNVGESASVGFVKSEDGSRVEIRGKSSKRYKGVESDGGVRIEVAWPC